MDNKTNESLRHLELSEYSYSGLLENGFEMFTVVLFAITLTACSAVMTFSAIWYDYYGTTNYRTLIHQIVTKMFWTSSLGVPMIEAFDVAALVTGPWPEWACGFNLGLRTGVKNQLLILSNFLILTRYLFIFHLKNPAAVAEKFWVRLILAWTIVVNVITSLAFVILSKRKPIIFYVCSDTNPDQDSNLGSNVYLEMFSFFFHLLLNARIKLFKNSARAQNIFSVDERRMTNLSMNIFGILVLGAFVCLNVTLSSLKPAEASSSPVNIFICISNYIGPACLGIIISAFYYTKNRDLRISVTLKAKRFLSWKQKKPIEPIG